MDTYFWSIESWGVLRVRVEHGDFAYDFDCRTIGSHSQAIGDVDLVVAHKRSAHWMDEWREAWRPNASKSNIVKKTELPDLNVAKTAAKARATEIAKTIADPKRGMTYAMIEQYDDQQKWCRGEVAHFALVRQDWLTNETAFEHMSGLFHQYNKIEDERDRYVAMAARQRDFLGKPEGKD